MTNVDRLVTAIKVIAMFSLCSSAAWASNPVQDHGTSVSQDPPGITSAGVNTPIKADDDDSDDDSSSGSDNSNSNTNKSDSQ